MNSRQRVIAAINHQAPDRVPVDIGASFATGLTVLAYSKVRSALGISSGPIRVLDPVQMLAEVEQPIMDALGTDVVGLHPGGGHVHGWQNWTIPQGPDVRMPADIQLRERPAGGWEQLRKSLPTNIMAQDSFYFDSVKYTKWLYPNPDSLTDEILSDIEERARLWHESTDLAILLNSSYAISNCTNPDFLCDLILEKNEAHESLEKWADALVCCLGKLLDATKKYVNVMVFSGDAGSQNAAFLSPDLYREMIVPHMRKVSDYLHKNSAVKFFLHSCGSVYELIECFIDMGVDILNPLQVSAANMDPERLVNQFGGRIVFWGGGCDSQHVLPRGTEADVRDEVARRFEAYSVVPGFVFSQVHNIQPDVPVQNIIAMLEEVKRQNRRCFRHL